MFGRLLTYRGRPLGWLSLLAMAEVAMVFGPGRLWAADASITNVWTGAGANGAISLSGNWQGGVVPETKENKAKNDVWIFQSLGSGLTTPLVDQGDSKDDQNVAQISFSAGAPSFAFSNASGYSIDIWGDSSGLGIYQGSASVQTFSGQVNLRGDDVVFDLAGGNLNFSGPLAIGKSSGSLTVTGPNTLYLDTLSNESGSSVSFVIDGAQVVLQDDLTWMTTTTINTGGSLLLGADDLIVDQSSNKRRSSLVLGGGTFNTGGYDADFLGSLTLTADSVVDLGSGSSVLVFQSEKTDSDLDGHTLTINNWSGTQGTGGGGDQIIFGALAGHVPNVIYSDIQFNLNGTLYSGMLIPSPNASYAGMFEVIPFIPEPSTYGSLAFLVAAVGWRERRRISRWFQSLV